MFRQNFRNFRHRRTKLDYDDYDFSINKLFIDETVIQPNTSSFPLHFLEVCSNVAADAQKLLHNVKPSHMFRVPLPRCFSGIIMFNIFYLVSVYKKKKTRSGQKLQFEKA